MLLLSDRYSIGAIEGIENLVLSLLTQLSLSLLPTRNVDDDGDDDTDEPETSTLKKPKARKVELKLADRRKVTSDGYTMFRFIYTLDSKALSVLWVHELYAIHRRRNLWVRVPAYMLLDYRFLT